MILLLLLLQEAGYLYMHWWCYIFTVFNVNKLIS
jgi:hypothetical protein